MKKTPKAVKAWAIVDENGLIGRVSCHLLISDCPYAIYEHKDSLERGKRIEVLITPIKKQRRGKV